MATGATLLVVPGLGLGRPSWAPTLTSLRTPPAVVRLLPGFGEPAGRATDLRPRALADRLVAGLPDGDGPLVLCGHSASCQVVAHAAALAPGRIAGLVLVGPTTDPRAATWPRLVRRWLATAGHETPRQVPALVAQYRRTTLRSMRRAMDVARADPIRDALAGAGCPVLVVRGHADRICPVDWAETVAGCGGAGSRVTTLRGGAHMVPQTHGAELAEAMASFLAGLGPRGASGQLR